MHSSNLVYIFKSNPNFSSLVVYPGDWVVIKPNLVKESKETDITEWRSVVTDPRLIRLVCEYVCRQLRGKGRVTICDAPQTDSSFSRIVELLRLQDIADKCKKKYRVPVEIVDLRNEEWISLGGIVTERRTLNGDPEGAVRFNVGRDSFFHGHPGEGRYYGADYDSSIVNNHHHGNLQEYLICGTPVKADVFINMPKMKTHKKTGVTLSLKNLVGINADKNWLPHHTEGAPENGGDEYPDMIFKRKLEHFSVKVARRLALRLPGLGPFIARRLRRAGTAAFGAGNKVIRSGNWYGNNTTWRMVLDLNRCLLFGNADGSLRKDNPKRYYSVVDGIIGMDGSGPMQGDPVNSGVVMIGCDPVAVDAVAATIMGFNWRRIPMIREAFKLTNFPITQLRPEDIKVHSDVADWNCSLINLEGQTTLNFRPHFGWAGHIERRAKS
jgi:uncharacterized protein (DUF362 family)